MAAGRPGTEKIRQAVLELMGSKKLAGIGVSEVCRQAGVSRGSFYYHYAIVDDVVTEVIEDFFRELERSLDHLHELSQSDIQTVCTISAQCFERHQELLRTLFGGGAGELVEQRFRQLSTRLFREHGTVDVITSSTAIYLDEYITSGFYGLYRRWVMEGCGAPAGDIARICANMAGLIARGWHMGMG